MRWASNIEKYLTKGWLDGFWIVSRHPSKWPNIYPLPCFPSSIYLSKLINPRDANPVGAMHGGNVLSLLEEAGIIAATRHINTHKDSSLPPCVAALARMEKVSFVSYADWWCRVVTEITWTSLDLHTLRGTGRLPTSHPCRWRGRSWFWGHIYIGAFLWSLRHHWKDQHHEVSELV